MTESTKSQGYHWPPLFHGLPLSECGVNGTLARLKHHAPSTLMVMSALRTCVCACSVVCAFCAWQPGSRLEAWLSSHGALTLSANAQ